ncbi:MAG: hypothetical protein ACREJ4_09585 [Candidatus Methylomirabilaceae bacterium]
MVRPPQGRVLREMEGGALTPLKARFASLGTLLLTRAALLVGLALAIGLWGLLRFHGGQTLVAQRAPEREKRGVKDVKDAPAIVAKAAPTEAPAVPALAQPAPSTSLAPAPGATPPALPPLVPAKQGEPLRVLILPIPDRPGVRSAVAAGLREQLGTVEPPSREFPSGASVDDLVANRRLGHLFGVRYILDVAVNEGRSGYLVVLRAADAETGGIVARRDGRTSDEGTLEAVSERLAKELRQQLR